MPTLILLAHVPTDAVNEGFLPAAQRLGLKVILLTDQAEAHRRHFEAADRPACPDSIVECDVFNPLAIIDEISSHAERPAAIFSNSDHLQTSTALAADYFGRQGLENHLSDQEQGSDAQPSAGSRRRHPVACRCHS